MLLDFERARGAIVAPRATVVDEIERAVRNHFSAAPAGSARSVRDEREYRYRHAVEWAVGRPCSMSSLRPRRRAWMSGLPSWKRWTTQPGSGRWPAVEYVPRREPGIVRRGSVDVSMLLALTAVIVSGSPRRMQASGYACSCAAERIAAIPDPVTGAALLAVRGDRAGTR